MVVSTHFNGGSPMVIVGPTNQKLMTSPSLKVTEHFTMTGSDTIRYEAWIEDPLVLTAPFKMDFPWHRDQSYEGFEYACHEGNTLISCLYSRHQPALCRRPRGGVGAPRRFKFRHTQAKTKLTTSKSRFIEPGKSSKERSVPWATCCTTSPNGCAQRN